MMIDMNTIKKGEIEAFLGEFEGFQKNDAKKDKRDLGAGLGWSTW